MEDTTSASLGGARSAVLRAEERLKASWEDGKCTARDLNRRASEALDRVSDRVEGTIGARPKTFTFGALGAGLLLGFAAGMLTVRRR